MKVLFVVLGFSLTTVGLAAQTDSQFGLLNKQLNDQSVINFEQNGRRISFSVAEAKATYRNLWEDINPYSPQNSYFPEAMKVVLRKLRGGGVYVIENPFFPNAPGISLAMLPTASANYCTIPNTPIQNKPCVQVFINSLMLEMRAVEKLAVPDERFKHQFALTMAHEGVHHERGIEGWQNLTQQKVQAEEIRAWFKVMHEMVAPLRQANRPVSAEYQKIDDLLKPCLYKLPCKNFETYITEYKTPKQLK